MYIKNVCEINDKREIEKHYAWNAGCPGKKREKKKKKTPEEVEKQNRWIRKRNLRRIMELNFRGGDYHVTLTCAKDKRPELEEALKVIRSFRDKLSKAYKKQGWELKYIITTELGERGAVHWHMVVNNCSAAGVNTADLIHKLWDRGRPYLVPLDDNREYQKLADYIVKETEKRIAEGKTLEKQSYICSRNLKRPVIKKKKVRASRWAAVPSVPKGWHLVADSLVNGRNPFTGYPYQHYVIQRNEEKRSERSKGLYIP